MKNGNADFRPGTGPEPGRSLQLLTSTRNPAAGGADPSQPRAAGRVFTAPAPLHDARPARPPRAPNERERRELRGNGAISVPSPGQTPEAFLTAT